MRISRVVLVCSLATVVAAGGALAQTTERPTVRGDRSVTAVVGARGADLVLKRGVRLRVPARASTGSRMTLRTTPTRQPWPFRRSFRAVGSALEVHGTVRGSEEPVEISLRVGRVAPRARRGERLVYVIEHVARHEVSGGRMVTAGANPMDRSASTTGGRMVTAGANPMDRSAPSRPSGYGDPRAGTWLDPLLVRGRTDPDAAGVEADPSSAPVTRPSGYGDPRAGTWLDPLLVRGRSDPDAAEGDADPSVVPLPRPGAETGDPRAGAHVEPASVDRTRPGSTTGSDGSSPTVDRPTRLRTSAEAQTYWLIGTASYDTASQSLVASFPLDGELRRVTFGFTTWRERAPDP